jgi:hypothetical protein
MEHLPKLPVRKYEVHLTKINTGESEIHRFYALGSGSAKEIIKKIYDDNEYKIDSLDELISVVKILIKHPCPN